MVRETDIPLVWLRGEVKTPPFSKVARLEVGLLLRRLQKGERLEMPHSKPISSVGRRCHELRVPDENASWRLIYRIDEDAIIIAGVFAKQSAKTLRRVIETCKRRLHQYDVIAKAE